MFIVTMSQTLQDGKLENKVYLLEIGQKLYTGASPSPPPHPYPPFPPSLLIPTFSSIWLKLNGLLIIFSDILGNVCHHGILKRYPGFLKEMGEKFVDFLVRLLLQKSLSCLKILLRYFGRFYIKFLGVEEWMWCSLL